MPQDAGDCGDERLVDRAGAQQRRRREGEAVAVAAQRHEPGAALLHDHGRRAGSPPASSQAWHVPSVGWPANGSSPAGVKIRTR